MGDRPNRFSQASSGNILRNVARGVNDINKQGQTLTVPSETKKTVKDVDINLVDEYEKNELLFGYNNLEDVKKSIKKTGVQGVTINVFTEDNGRYVCFSGNTRLKALKELGEKKVSVIIEGDRPSDHELMLRAIYNNVQRGRDPLHIAQKIDMLEASYREQGLVGQALSDEIAAVTGLKLTSQKMYKRITKLHPMLQQLFNREDVPYVCLLKVCKQLPEDKIEDFVSIYNELSEENEISNELINHAYMQCVKKESGVHKNTAERAKLSKVYKPILNLSARDDGSYYVPESKKEIYLEQVELLENELEKIKTACR